MRSRRKGIIKNSIFNNETVKFNCLTGSSIYTNIMYIILIGILKDIPELFDIHNSKKCESYIIKILIVVVS